MYTGTATNTVGPSTTLFRSTVNDAAPTNLTYATNPAVYTKGTAIAPNTPSTTGGTATSYAISPTTVPAGLSFSTSSGILSGTPTAVAAAASYTVTATNSGGS